MARLIREHTSIHVLPAFSEMMESNHVDRGTAGNKRLICRSSYDRTRQCTRLTYCTMHTGAGRVCRPLVFFLVQSLVWRIHGVLDGNRSYEARKTVDVFRLNRHRQLLKRHRQLGIPAFSSDSVDEHIPKFSPDSDDDTADGKGKGDGQGKGMTPDDDAYYAPPPDSLPPTDDYIGKGKGMSPDDDNYYAYPSNSPYPTDYAAKGKGKGHGKDEKTRRSKKDKKESKSDKKEGKGEVGGDGNPPGHKPSPAPKPTPSSKPQPTPPAPVSLPTMIPGDSEDARKKTVDELIRLDQRCLDSATCASTYILCLRFLPQLLAHLQA
jgi:hypothetical protein